MIQLIIQPRSAKSIGCSPSFVNSTDGTGSIATGGGSGGGGSAAAVPATQTVTYAGSGLVFVNTYTSNVTAAFQNEIVAAENYLQSQFTNVCTVNCSFDLQSLPTTVSGENSFASSVQHATYSQLVNALQTHATSANELAAVASLKNLSDPSQGVGFDIPIGMAKILGLANGYSGTDNSIVLNNYYWTSTNLMNYPTNAQAVIEHELSEGIMGRVGTLGKDWFFGSNWAPMDLFRFTASGQRDFTGGQDGQLTYFSPNGINVYTGLQFHNSLSSGVYDGADLADWNQVGADANATDPFGPGGPGYTDPSAALSATDLEIMDVLGWTQTPSYHPTNDFNGAGVSDILLQNSGGSLVDWVMYNGKFSSWNSLGTEAGWKVVGTGDFKDNGTSDILLQNSSGQIVEWMMGNGTFSSWSSLGTQTGWNVVATGDFNGDHTSDILLQNNSGQIVEWTMQNGAVSSWRSLGTQTGWNVVGTGDFYDNGTSDILLQNSSGQIVEWTMQNGAVSSWRSLGTQTGWNVVGTGDFYDNGTSDILLQNSSGQIVEWTMQNGALSSWRSLGTQTGWNVVATGDYYGNGTSDILLQNGSGQIVEWTMQNGALSSWQSLGTQAGWNVQQGQAIGGAPIANSAVQSGTASSLQLPGIQAGSNINHVTV